MSLTTAQITSAIRKKILEETDDIVSDDDVLLNANLAYDDLKYRTFTNDQIKSATLTLTDGESSLPNDFGTLYGPGFKSTTDRTSFQERSIMDFNKATDTEQYMMTIEGGKIKVNPSDTAQIIIKYFPSYNPLSTTQNPLINGYLHELIIYGAVWRIYENLQNEAMAEFYKTRFEEDFLQKTQSLSNYQEDNMGGNQMFNGINLV